MPANQPFRASALYLAVALCLAALLSGCASREERVQRIQTRAESALFHDQTEDAIEILREGLEKYADSVRLRVALSRALQIGGEIEEAATLLEEAVALDPEEDQLWVKIGELRAQLGQSESAARAFEEYLRNHGDDFLAWKALALEHEKSGRLTSAIQAASRWNELTPSSAPALKLGQLYLASNNAPQARSWFAQAAAYVDAAAAKEAMAELIRLETSEQQFQQASLWLDQYRQRYASAATDPRIRESLSVLESWEQARREIAEAAAEVERLRRSREQGGIEATPSSGELESTAVAEEEQEPVREPAAPASEPARPESPAPGSRPPEALFGEAEPPRASSRGNGVEATPAERNRPPAPAGGDSSPSEEAEELIAMEDYDAAIGLLWDLLGENDQDAHLWRLLSEAYYGQRSWFDAEATILEARRRDASSEAIAAQYLRTITRTQNPRRIQEELNELRSRFPRSEAIALAAARALREMNAPYTRVAAVYRDYLSMVGRTEAGVEEANRYLQRRD